MNFVRTLKIQFLGVIEDFKLNSFLKIGIGSEMENLHC
jgi:hypothetical protein